MKYEKRVNFDFSKFKLAFGFLYTMMACKFILSDLAVRGWNVLPRHFRRELVQRDAKQIKVVEAAGVHIIL